MKNDQGILNIIKKRILEDYQNDISVLVRYGNKKDRQEKNLGLGLYFIPKTEKGKSLSTQFIVEGVSYDLFPISWDRLIANAAMDSPQAYLLLDTEVVYCADEEALERFNGLKESLKTMLSGRYEEALLNKAYEYFNETYIYLHNMVLYGESLQSIRLEAGKLVNKIANVLGFANQTYYQNGNGSVLRDSMKLESLPLDYQKLVDGVLFAETGDQVYKNACELVKVTRGFLLAKKKENSQEESFEILFTGYYEELKKSINKCRNALDQKDYYALYELLSFIQEEVAQFLAKVEEGIWYDDRNAWMEYQKAFFGHFDQELLELVTKRDDEGIRQAIDRFESDFRDLMKENAIHLMEYTSLDAFEQDFMGKKASGEV